MLAIWAVGARAQQVIHRAPGRLGQAQYVARLGLPVPFKHLGQAPRQHIDKAAHQQAENQGAGDKRVGVMAQQFNHAQITWPRLKIGKYMAMTSPPTMTPSTTMMIGSSNVVRWSTCVSTSLS